MLIKFLRLLEGFKGAELDAKSATFAQTIYDGNPTMRCFPTFSDLTYDHDFSVRQDVPVSWKVQPQNDNQAGESEICDLFLFLLSSTASHSR